MNIFSLAMLVIGFALIKVRCWMLFANQDDWIFERCGWLGVSLISSHLLLEWLLNFHKRTFTE